MSSQNQTWANLVGIKLSTEVKLKLKLKVKATVKATSGHKPAVGHLNAKAPKTWASLVGTKPMPTKPVSTKPMPNKPVSTLLSHKPVSTKPVSTKPVAIKVKVTSKGVCIVCTKTEYTELCSQCHKVFCFSCLEYSHLGDICYKCAHSLKQTPTCGSVIDGKKCGIDLDPNTDYYHFWKMANDPDCPEYIMEYTYAGVPPPPKWLPATQQLGLPKIAHECGYCHTNLCEKHVVITPSGPQSNWHTCHSCAVLIRKKYSN